LSKGNIFREYLNIFYKTEKPPWSNMQNQPYNPDNAYYICMCMSRYSNTYTQVHKMGFLDLAELWITMIGKWWGPIVDYNVW
jgi:hypothetical protein